VETLTTASPYLAGLLTQWASAVDELKKEVIFQKDLLDPITLATHGNRLAMRERRRRDIQNLIENFQEARGRWDERLQRIEKWKSSVTQLQETEAHLQGLLGAGVWLEKARQYQDSFVQRLNRGAVRLEAAHQIVRYNIEAWITLLQEREGLLQELTSREKQADASFFVSRARKQPELDFLAEQASVESALGQELAGMRHLLNHLRARVRRAITVIGQRTSGAEIFYEIHKQEMLVELKTLEETLDKRREQILSEALAYEGGRHLLRKLNGLVHNVRCLEDIPQTKRTGGLFS